MSLQENYFTPFKQSIDCYVLPECFTYPFYYQPHPLCVLAAKELQTYLETQNDWVHNFGMTGDKETATGKMFGVLLVQNKHNEIGYLSAFSGKLADTNHLQHFVPPVFDMLAEDSFFRVGQLEINRISEHITRLAKNPQIALLESVLNTEVEASMLKIKAHRKNMIEGRKTRKARRQQAQIELSADKFLLLKEQLATQSIQAKNQLRDLTLYWGERIQKAEDTLNQLTDELTALTIQRKNLSATLQKKLFAQYCFLNAKGVTKNLGDIFLQTSQYIPPAGAGECAAPKLLQYAFKEGMKPLAIAEFWWGESPKSEIRKHRNFYPACQGKCLPILGHMLDGIKMDDNPLLSNPGLGKTIEIVFQDDVMLVINKPAELLSVPGKNIDDSVYTRVRQRYPSATGSIIVHRLDMSTSGLMLIALTREAHKSLQKQFIKRTVKKRYVALLDGLVTADEGVIDLPLRVDLDDRPRQLVCYEHGKHARTQWQVIEHKNQQSKVYFHPITGRTHQLRVHSAHINGLNTPILGDDLYGKKANRLHLHAETIEFNHPVTRELMCFQLDAEF